MSKELLRRLPLFASLSEEDLDRLYEMAETVSVASGEVLLREGDPGDAVYVVLDGAFEVTKRSGQQEVALASCRKQGEVLGEMSLLRDIPRNATVRASTDSRLLKISQDSFEYLLSCSPSAALSIVRTVIDRLRSTEIMLHQSEKMAALGTLAAGLAHELNNPAAAVQRSVTRLREALMTWQQLTARLEESNLDAFQMETVRALRAAILTHTLRPVELDPLARMEQEGALQAWLVAHGVKETWELAPELLSLGWQVETLEQLSRPFSPDQFPILVQWLAAGGSTYMLLDEMGKSADRISEIVKAVKNYSYLDQAPVQSVDVHAGLENTLVILRQKIKPGIRIRREYAADLPRIEAYASELNQVWTNLIDNALAAMGDEGELSLRTYTQGGQVVVEVCDTGPGIPPDIKERIFEPFFTTKPQGVGNGLGLHIVYNSIVDKHQGRIEVTSRPGATCFRILLPDHIPS
jgi:signal transduction histidine kinase